MIFYAIFHKYEKKISRIAYTTQNNIILNQVYKNMQLHKILLKSKNLPLFFSK